MRGDPDGKLRVVRRRKHGLRLGLLAAVAVAAAGLSVTAYALDLLRPLELNTVDARYRIRGTRAPPKGVVLVALDPRSLKELGVRPPLARSLHARLLERLHTDHPRLIVYDFQFIGHTSSREDRALVGAISAARPVLLGTHESGGGALPVPAGEREPRRLGATVASVGVPTDSDGKIRRMLYAPIELKSLDVAAAEVATGKPVSERHFPDNTAWIDYRGPPGTVRTYSFSDVLAGRVPRGAFANKIVVVGPTDPIEKDVFPTPMSDNVMAGPEIHVNAIATILGGFPLVPVAGAIDVLLILLFAALPPLAALRRSALVTLAVSAGALAVLALGSQLAFDSGRIVAVTYPALGLVLAATGSVAVDYFGERRERRHMRVLFSRFVPAEVVDDVIERADEDLRLGGVRREGTVMFTDLRGFTTFSESLEPERVVEVINQYLGEMSDAILGHGGTLVSYMGDGIMALFGAPLEQPDHADRALGAAREMLTTRLPRFNTWLRAQGFDHEFRMGIGLNSGDVMSGNVGSERRLEYTAIGDTTNTAARLEGMTKDAQYDLFVADSTRARMHRAPDDLVYVDELPIRGKQSTIKVWTLTVNGAPGGA